ncbi:hypothetical protein AWB74_01729 [Caballeronia arvi]|uniref:Uncharacterized protein n=2 Tax=Caballeronia arvi TaxID=1777135 RepID=A0A158HE62_9BURK|nr:hypothetical protein AWB74_01729 [Caballeronia arvi]
MSGEGMDEAAKAALRVLIDNRRRNARDMEAREELEHRISRMKSEQFRVESEHRRVLEAAQAAHASAVAQAFESVAGSAESKQRVQPRMTNAQKSQLQQDRPST